MRISSVLHFVAGVGVVVALSVCLVAVEGRKVEDKKNELTKPETNSIRTPTLFSFFKRLLPDKTLESIRAAVTLKPQPKAKSLTTDATKSRSMKTKKKPVKETKTKVALPTTSSAKKITTQAATRLRTSVNPKIKTTTSSKVKVTPKITKKSTMKPLPTQGRKQKTGKELKSRQNSKTSFAAFNDEVPAPEEMQVLTYDQKRNRLRQELVRETEDNCLAKILCGTGSKPKPKERNNNTLVSDTAYLIKEFFNIFDFTIDDVREEIKEMDDVNKKAYEAEEAEEKKKQKEREEEEEEEEEEEDDDPADDEQDDDDIFRKTPTSEVPNKKKYTTRTPTSKAPNKTRTSHQPVVVKEETTPEPVMAQPKTRRPKPVSAVELTTSGDIVPMTKESSSSTVSSNMDRLGEVVTPSSNFLTSTLVSTSMSGSATLKPIDTTFSIPLKTAKDNANDDDDEDDDNRKYDDDNDDGYQIHRVTLEELVGDIQLSPSDFEMIRRGRSMRQRQPRMKISLKNVTSDKYIQAKLREMKMVKTEAKKLKIAQKVARSMREPRQCRQFSQVAQQVLQTCPLTTEVIRFFNTNLKNGTSIEVKRVKPGDVTQGGGLVLLNNDHSGSQQAYFVDNSPQTANTKIESDLKNPSIPSSFNQDEDQYTVYEKRPNPNPENANLNQNGQDITKRPVFTTEAPKKKESNKEDSDEEEQDDEEQDSDEEDEEDDDVVGRRDEEDEEEEDEEEDEEQDDTRSSREEEYEDDGSEEENGSDYDSGKDKKTSGGKKVLTIKASNDHNKIQGAETNQPNIKIAIRPKPLKKPVSPTPTLPPGIIRVYGVPQPSFDNEFSQLSPIGQPINLFGDEFLDSPPYKRRRQLGKYGHRTSKKAKTGEEDDEAESVDNVAYNARIPKHPPLEPYVNDGGIDDDDDDGDNKQAYQNPKNKHHEANHGKPLGGVKGADGDDDDDDKKVASSEKRDTDDDDKDNSAESQPPPVKIHSIDEPPFVPSVMYSVPVNPQANPHDYYGGGGSPQYGPSSQYDYGYQTQYHQQQQYHQNVPVRRPHAYRPIVRPIKIIPDVSVPITGVNFRPSRPEYRPGRLYPIYHHGRK